MVLIQVGPFYKSYERCCNSRCSRNNLVIIDKKIQTVAAASFIYMMYKQYFEEDAIMGSNRNIGYYGSRTDEEGERYVNLIR